MRYLIYTQREPYPEPGRQWLPLWTTTLDHGHHIQGYVSVRQTKAPKRRFDPGQYLRYEGQLYEVMYAYRTEEAPSEWVYYLEERRDLTGSRTPLQTIVEDGYGSGGGVQRVISGVFYNDQHARDYFSDIYRAADALSIRNGDLLRKAQMVSSGAVEVRP